MVLMRYTGPFPKTSQRDTSHNSINTPHTTMNTDIEQPDANADRRAAHLRRASEIEAKISQAIHHISFGCYGVVYLIFLGHLLFTGKAFCPLICGTYWLSYEVYYSSFSPIRRHPMTLHYKAFACLSIVNNILAVIVGYDSDRDELGFFPLKKMSQRFVALFFWLAVWAVFQYSINQPYLNDRPRLTKIKYNNYVVWFLTQMLMLRLPAWKPNHEFPSPFSCKFRMNLFLPYEDGWANFIMAVLLLAVVGYGISKLPVDLDHSTSPTLITPPGIFRAYVEIVVIGVMAGFSSMSWIHNLPQRQFTILFVVVASFIFLLLRHHLPNDDADLEPSTTRAPQFDERVTFSNHKQHHEGNCMVPNKLAFVYDLIGYRFIKHSNAFAWACFSALEYGGITAYGVGSSRIGLVTVLLLIMANLLDYIHDAYKENDAGTDTERRRFIFENKTTVYGALASAFLLYIFLLQKKLLLFGMHFMFMLIGFRVYSYAKRRFIGAKSCYSGILGAIMVTSFPLKITEADSPSFFSFVHFVMLAAAAARLAASEIVHDTFDHELDRAGNVRTIPVEFGIQPAIRVAMTLYGLSSTLLWFALGGNLVAPLFVWALGVLCARNRLEWAHLAPALFAVPLVASALLG